MEDIAKFRRTIATISLIAFCTLIILSFAFTIEGRVQTRDSIIYIPPFYPDDTVDYMGSCDWTAMNYTSDVLYCNGDKVFYSMSLYSKKAIQVTIWIDPIAVGDLIDQWGIPTGVEVTGTYYKFCYIHWSNRAVLTLCKQLSPHALIRSITWVNGNKNLLPWKGFSSYGS